jgi:hypothetical protein
MRRLVIAALALIAGCQSDSTKLADELERSDSWKATIAAIDTAEARNRIPSRFADDAIADANAELAKSAKKIAELQAKGVKPKQ